MARGAVSLCAPHSPAQAVAHSFASGSQGALELGAKGRRGVARAAQAAVSTAAQRRVCVIAGLSPVAASGAAAHRVVGGTDELRPRLRAVTNLILLENAEKMDKEFAPEHQHDELVLGCMHLS